MIVCHLISQSKWGVFEVMCHVMSVMAQILMKRHKCLYIYSPSSAVSTIRALDTGPKYINCGVRFC